MGVYHADTSFDCAENFKAFAPVIAGTDGRQIAIAWRDDERKGNCRRLSSLPLFDLELLQLFV